MHFFLKGVDECVVEVIVLAVDLESVVVSTFVSLEPLHVACTTAGGVDVVVYLANVLTVLGSMWRLREAGRAVFAFSESITSWRRLTVPGKEDVGN